MQIKKKLNKHTYLLAELESSLLGGFASLSFLTLIELLLLLELSVNSWSLILVFYGWWKHLFVLPVTTSTIMCGRSIFFFSLVAPFGAIIAALLWLPHHYQTAANPNPAVDNLRIAVPKTLFNSTAIQKLTGLL